MKTYDVSKKNKKLCEKLNYMGEIIIVIVVLIKIETRIGYNKIKSTRKHFELCLTV